MALLDIRGLKTHFKTDDGWMHAVDGVDIAIDPGQTVCVVGESGCGKSVTAKTVLKLIDMPPGKIVAGQVLWQGRDLVPLSMREMQRIRAKEIAIVFQEPMTSLNPVYTCGSQVMEAILLHQKISRKEARKKTLRLFEQVQLPDPERVFRVYPHQISGGQKQRVMIAMAMSCNPRILIADEPTTALDVTVQKTILDLMLQLQREQDMGIMFITHDLGVIAELADTVMVMYKGKVVEQGPVLEIFSNPKHPYTKSLLACRPPLDRRVVRLPVSSDFMKIDNDGVMTEIPKTVGEALNSVIITKEQRIQDHRELYSRSKILELEHIKTWFPKTKSLFGKTREWVKAVDDVSLDVYEGETLGLVGESGCGKTTLGRTILRLNEPTEGKIYFQRNDLLKLNAADMRHLRKDMQIIFQDPYSSLNPRMTIGEALMEPMQVHGLYTNSSQRRERVMELLKKVGLEERQFNRYPHEFSGGQRQRVCIARALSLNPKFIICDESVSALDVSVQAQVLNLLNDLKREFKFTYIFISHDLSVVKFMSDRMVVMNRGKIEEMGDADAIYQNPQSEYTRKLISSIPKGQLTDIRASIEKKRAVAAW